MTVYPGSLDNLYYNGILPYIPYDAYEMPPVVAQQTPPGGAAGYPFGMDGYNPKDDFSYQVPDSRNSLNKKNGNIIDSASNKSSSVANWLKGALAIGLLGASLFGICKLSKVSMSSINGYIKTGLGKVGGFFKSAWTKVVDFFKNGFQRVKSFFKKP